MTPCRLFSLSEGITHLAPVGTVLSTYSDNYGTYNMRCVANIDHLPKIAVDDIIQWGDRWHPRKWASAFYVGDTDQCESRYSSLYVALAEDNHTWYKDNPECPYVKYTECPYVKYIKTVKARPVQLPVLTSDKKLAKFLAASQSFIYTGPVGSSWGDVRQ